VAFVANAINFAVRQIVLFFVLVIDHYHAA